MTNEETTQRGPTGEQREAESRRKMIDALVDANYRRINACDGPNESKLEFWTGKRGLVIVQFWSDGGLNVYHEQDVPATWTELAEWLRGDDESGGQ